MVWAAVVVHQVIQAAVSVRPAMTAAVTEGVVISRQPNKSFKGTAPTGAASQYCAGRARFALRAPLSPLALRYMPEN